MHRLDVGMSKHLLPVNRGLLVAEPLACQLRPRSDIVRGDHEARHRLAIGVVLGDAAIGDRVQPAHPADADQADADLAQLNPEVLSQPLAVRDLGLDRLGQLLVGARNPVLLDDDPPRVADPL